MKTIKNKTLQPLEAVAYQPSRSGLAKPAAFHLFNHHDNLQGLLPATTHARRLTIPVSSKHRPAAVSVPIIHL
jgi:hypothetical protein